MKKFDPKQWQFARKQQLKNLERIRRRNKVAKELNSNRGNYRRAHGRRRDFRPYRGRKDLAAPENFSFIDNTAEMVGFFQRMEKAFKAGRDVFVDFSGTTHLTPDSLAVFVSHMKDTSITRGLQVSGNEPQDELIKKRFIESGFYEIVVTRNKKREPASGSFKKKMSKKVQPQMIDEMVSFATDKLFGEYRKCGGVTNALLETMGNTRGHAAGDPSRHETWWAYVHCDTKSKIATYCLVDNGVGIFKGRKVSLARQALNKLGITSNIDILKKMLLRQIESSTGIPYRGRGIPSIYKSLKRGDIRNLTFIANDVIAKVEKNEYHTLSPPFKGTFVSWEYHGDGA
jgi:hypothetical protein